MKRWQQRVHPSFTETVYIVYIYHQRFNGQFYDPLKFELKRYVSHCVSIFVRRATDITFIYLPNKSKLNSRRERTSERVLYLHFAFSPSEGKKKDRRQVPLIWYDTFFAFHWNSGNRWFIASPEFAWLTNSDLILWNVRSTRTTFFTYTNRRQAARKLKINLIPRRDTPRST